ncbi:hypothetical protein JOM56_005283, partial [Amanita muscaria]
PSHSDGFMSPPQYKAVIRMDTHVYQILFEKVGLHMCMQDAQKCSGVRYNDVTTSTLESVVVGDWTPAMMDFAKYLSGRGVGSRYDGTY